MPPETAAYQPFPSQSNHGTGRHLTASIHRPYRIHAAITHPEAALRALIEFFEIHQILMRDDFVRLLKKSQR